ncbi:MAG: META domain-containing protein [Parvularculaceae bacterium]
MSKFSLLHAALPALALAACEQASAPPPAAPRADSAVERIVYRCGAATVRFSETAEGDGSLEVDGDKTVHALKAVPAASGAKYEGPAVLFWSKGDRATLSLKGVDYPECVENGAAIEASGGDIFKARGNEPGWLLELGSSTFRFTGDYGELVIGGATPDAETLSDGALYTVADENLSIRVYDRLCHDDSTGAPLPKAVTVTLGDKSYMGCGGDSASLLVGDWKITRIGGAGVVPASHPTIGFDHKGAVYGDASCNRYSGRYGVTAEGLAINDTAATEMACADAALMDQEQRLLGLLQSADRFDIADDGSLVLYARDEEAIRARR